jgi:O-antigen ligase
VLLSLTRASYIQWLASVGLVFAVAFRRFSWRKRVVTAMLAMLFVSLAAGALVVLAGVEQITDRVVVTTSGEDESASSRLTIWKIMAGHVLENPFRALGGFGQLGASYIGEGFWSDAGYWVSSYSAHSEYMDIFVRSGLVGVVIVMLIFWKVVRSGMTTLAAVPRAGPYYFSYAAAAFGAAFYGVFQESLRYPIFGMYFWFCAGFFSAGLMSIEQPQFAGGDLVSSPRNAQPAPGRA